MILYNNNIIVAQCLVDGIKIRDRRGFLGNDADLSEIHPFLECDRVQGLMVVKIVHRIGWVGMDDYMSVRKMAIDGQMEKFFRSRFLISFYEASFIIYNEDIILAQKSWITLMGCDKNFIADSL